MQPVVANKRTNDEKLLFTLSGVNTSFANSIRRCILSDIECVVFKTFPYEENKANFSKNTTRHTNEMLKQRLSCVPIHLGVSAPYSSLIIEVNVTNTTDQTLYVTTKDFKIKEKTTEKYISDSERDKIFPPNTITGDYIMFARLRPSSDTKKGLGESLSFTAEMDVSTAKENGMFSVASISCYTNTIDTAKLDNAWKEEKAQLEQNIQMALSKGDINLEDAIDIREIKNIKLANQLLKVKRKALQEQKQQQAMQIQAMQAQQALKSQEMSAQLVVQQQQAEIQGKMQLKQAEIAFEIEKQNNEAVLKSKLMQEEFNYNIQLRGLDSESLSQREDQREGAKSKRISQANTEQSKLIQQRKNNLPPVNFESNEDSLDGFDLSEFSPR